MANIKDVTCFGLPLNNNIMKRLIDQGLDPNIKDADGNTPLHVAAKKRQADVVENLLKHGANPNTIDAFNNTPLHCSLFWHTNFKLSAFTIMKNLLDHGADPNMRNKIGSTPLLNAVITLKTDFVKILMEHGANPTLVNKMGDSPIRVIGNISCIYTNEEKYNIYPLIDVLIQYIVMRTINANINNGFCYQSYIFYQFKNHLVKNNLSEEISCYKYMVNFALSCISEIFSMREDFISSAHTLFKFVSENCIRANLVDRNTALRVIDELLLRLHDEKYAHCKDLIYASIKHSVLVDRLCDLLICCKAPRSANIASIFTMNSLCIYNLTKYLSKEDILNMILALSGKFRKLRCSVSSLKRSGEVNEYMRKKLRK